MSIVNERMKQLRSQSDITLKEMADKIGVSEATVQRYESGKIAKVPYKAIICYANTFGVAPGYLMGWEDVSIDDETRNRRFNLQSYDIKLPNIPTPTNVFFEPKPDTTKAIQTYLSVFMENENIRKLIEAAAKCDENDIKLATDFLTALNRKEGAKNETS